MINGNASINNIYQRIQDQCGIVYINFEILFIPFGTSVVLLPVFTDLCLYVYSQTYTVQ
jgi:hypothetical protein